MRYDGNFDEFAYPLPVGAIGVSGFGGVNSVALASDGAVWATLVVNPSDAPTSGGVAALIPATGTVNVFVASPPRDFYSSVAHGPDSEVWAVHSTPGIENGGNAASSIDVFTAGPTFNSGIPIPSGTPALAQTLGADHLMYVASDPTVDAINVPPSEIFRFSATGSLVDTVALPAGSVVSQLTAGPDGAVWFTDSGLNKIGRVAQDGHVTFYAVPTGNAQLAGIAPGSDNALWFTETAANKIGRISTAGSVTEYAIPTPDANPKGIAAGPLGGCLPQTIYFTESNALGKLTFH